MDAAMQRLIARNMTATEIAGEMGLTRGSVIGRAHRLKMPLATRRPPRPPKSSLPATDDSRKDQTNMPAPSRTNTRPQRRVTSAGLPHVTTRNSTILHVYARPADMMPLATYDKSGSWWIRRDRPEEKHRSTAEAARHLANTEARAV